MNRVRRLLALLSMFFFLSGCAAVLLGVGAGVGIGTYKFIEGNLIRDYPLTYARAWDATNAALENLRISITDSINEGAEGKIESVRKDGKKVTIVIKDKGQGVSSIAIRIGTFGDEQGSVKIHDEIASISGI
ncbi:MAG: DUF3568 family protein [Nitrospiraceae bacterium]|nr:MAG: DUF3568 family protein [Nitrospiraceae bacterium]